MIVTTLISAVIWFVLFLVIRSPYFSFRHGWLALPDN